MRRFDVDLVRRAGRVARSEGMRPVLQRAVRRAYHALDAGALEQTILPSDIADPAHVTPVRPGPLGAGAGRVGWLTTAPSLGSGGHTTMFRMVRALEAAGLECVIFVDDRWGGELADHARVIREGWPEVRARVRSAEGGVDGVDACLATSWESAHVLVTRGAPTVRRLYFIQDYEPYFSPRGSVYTLAEDSYRLGLRHVALGRMIAEALRDEVGVGCDVIPFGCDTQTYRLLPPTPRSGIVFYSRPDVPRRGYLHARLAIEEFHRRHPDQEIHVYGQRVGDLRADVTWHGRMWPHQLNELYNRSLGGLAMSFTNITLVAGEMLAAGAVPVVNDSPFARAVLDNPHIGWARPTPGALADALSRLVEHPDPAARAAAAAQSITTTWADTEEALVAVVRDELGLPSGAPPGHARAPVTGDA